MRHPIRCAVLLASLATLLPAADAQLDRLLTRLSREAETFALSARKLIAQETLHQRAPKNSGRFHLRVGAQAATPLVECLTREIVSEYGWADFKGSPGALHEFREIVSVDGRPVRSREEARTTLTMGITSDDDRTRKRMLDQYARYTLSGAVADFGQLILLFNRRHLSDYSFTWKSYALVSAERVVVYTFEQTAGAAALTVIRGHQADRQRLQGTISFRLRDGLPIRIVLNAIFPLGKIKLSDEATVDYAMSQHGVLVPVSVRHRQLQDGTATVENRFQYSTFRKFTVTSDVKFDGPASHP